MTRACSECPAPIGPKNTSGRCRSCVARRNNADPAIVARRREAILAHYDKPGIREGYAQRRRLRNANPSEVEQAARVRQGRKMAAELIAANKRMTAEQRAANGRKRTATVLAWCPEDRRANYQALTRSGVRAAEARRLILDEVSAAERRRLAALTPFERQMEAVRTGRARIIDKPDLRPSGPAYSLTGNSMGML